MKFNFTKLFNYVNGQALNQSTIFYTAFIFTDETVVVEIEFKSQYQH